MIFKVLGNMFFHDIKIFLMDCLSKHHLLVRLYLSSYQTFDTNVERRYQRCAESRGFSPSTPVFSHQECRQGGFENSP